MKTTYKILYTTLFLHLFIGNIFAQNQENYSSADYDAKKQGYWILGLNGGTAYQQSDVKTNFIGWGAGLTLAKNLYYNPTAPISFDLRGRLLYTQTYGLDNEISTGILNNTALNGTDRNLVGETNLNYTNTSGVFSNHQTHIGELALEGVLNFENLRREKNIDLALYGGIGLDWHLTKIDQSRNGAQYDYSGLGTSPSVDELETILDLDFETTADGNEDGGSIGFMPAVGFELGYWLTPRFALGIGHKMTWARTDVLDGQQWTNANELTGDNDIYHYTNLGLKWIINEGKRTRLEPPIIKVANPSYSPYTVNDPNFTLRATIENVQSTVDVNSQFNQSVHRSYNFNPAGEVFTSNLFLKEGENTFIINASNAAGSASETITIYYNVPKQPRIEITNPTRNNETVRSKSFELRASSQELIGRSQIQVFVNGNEERNFKFDKNSGEITANIDLKEGRNRVVVSGENKAGKVKDEVSIVYEKQAEPPVVEITAPTTNNYETNRNTYEVEGNVKNVDRKSDIELLVNGRKQSDFSYNGSRFAAIVNLYEGENTVQVRAENNDGTASDQVVIIYNYNSNNNNNQTGEPVVNIRSTSDPNRNNGRSTVYAEILNVSNKNDIEFYVNGRRNNNFSFSRNEFSSTISVGRGNNTIQIKANNRYGQDQDEATITYGDYGGNNIPPTTTPNYQNRPSVSITNPRNTNSETSISNITIEANIREVNNKSDVLLYVNRRRITNFSYSTYNGRLQARINLQSGNNAIEIRVRNNAGEARDNVNIRLVQKQNNPPQVRIISVSEPSVRNKGANSEVLAEVRNISSKRDITFTVNGTRIGDSAYSFNASTGRIRAGISVRTGNNTVIITARNADGRDEDTATVRYQPPSTSVPPTITIVSPNNNQTVDNASVSLRSIIRNVNSKNDISITVNGSRVSVFSFSKGTVNAKVQLKSGQNKIIVKASNQDGTAQESVAVVYRNSSPPPIPETKKPTIAFTKPNSNGQTTNSKSYNVKARITDVAKRSDILFTVNGVVLSNTVLDSKGNFSIANVPLRKGENRLAIDAKNKAGNTKKTIIINYKPLSTNPPSIPTLSKVKVEIISISKPVSTPTNPSQGRTTVIAKIENIRSKDQIEFLFNDEKITDFTYNSRTKQMTGNGIFKKGKNVIVIKAFNSHSKAEASEEVDF